jgi:hypothetical protein
MTEILAPPSQELSRGERRRPRLTRAQELLSVVFGAWLVVGLFVDGWAHNHQKPETIFTPWHAILYSGFLASGAYALWLLRRSDRPGTRLADSLPVGQGLVLVGVATFAVGAAADLVWHSVFGIEVDIAALLSPTHLVMFLGAILLLTGPFRAAWSDASLQEPSMGELLPALVSLTLVSALIAFFFMYLTPFRRGNYGTGVLAYTTEVTRDFGAAQDYAEGVQITGVASVLVATVLYVGPLLLAIRRWRVPFGTATVLFTAVTALIGGIDAFDRWPPMLAAPAAGLVTDLLIRRLRPSPDRAWAVRTVGGAGPALLWLGFFGLFHLAYGVGWSPELWAGVTVMAALGGVGLGLLVAPPAVPAVPMG